MSSKRKWGATRIHSILLDCLNRCSFRALTLTESQIISTCEVQSIECFPKLILPIAFWPRSTESASTVEKKVRAFEAIYPFGEWFSSSKDVFPSWMMMVIVIHLHELLEIDISRLQTGFLFCCAWVVSHRKLVVESFFLFLI